MDPLVARLISIEDALYRFNSLNSNLYEAAIKLYQVLEYPVKPSQVVVNDKVKNFVFFKLDIPMQFSKEELSILETVKSVSVLFNLENKNWDKEANTFNKITFVAIDLECSMKDRSFTAYGITKIIGKAFHNVVFYLFRNNDSILFSGLLKDTKNGQVYLSDWFDVSISDYKNQILLSRLSYTNFPLGDGKELYLNMLYSISREYLVHPLSYFDIENFSVFDDFSFLEINERQKENRLYYQGLYNNDYIDNSEEIDLLRQEDEEFVLEEFDDDIFKELENEELEFSEAERDDPEDIDDINKEIFEDPLKLLEWVNGMGYKK